ncbi:hypothetical protein Tcan_05075 [Toxocara canis]|uniref:Uncharacterized protein n=1 Tax=Toxocara canis TaxID=6265 RepID=A0A0B2V5P1_TOXCA|nr:hypothetical protein Tcan_05075 [Toxocara canis]
MCCSLIGQIVYGAIMLVALGLTLGAMFSPGWTELKNQTEIAMGNPIDAVTNIHTTGIFPFLCRVPGQEANHDDDDDEDFELDDKFDIDYCVDFWNRLPLWEKVVVATICLALITEVVALIWTLVSLCACCCKQCFVFALPVLAFLAAIFLAITVIVFGINNKDFIGDVYHNGNNPGDVVNNIKETMTSEVGYSFYLACGALAAVIIDIIVGALTQCLAKFCM